MKAVGGYADYLALLTNDRHLDDVLIILSAEADVAQLQATRSRADELARQPRMGT